MAIIYKKTSFCSLQIALDQRTILFLACCVPQFDFVVSLVTLNTLGCEVDTDCGLYGLRVTRIDSLNWLVVNR